MESPDLCWHSSERHYILSNSTFTKRELREEELPRSLYTGEPVWPRHSQERLQNKAATLQSIAANTKIPVPQFENIYMKDGLLHLQTKRSDGVQLSTIDPSQKADAVAKVEETMN
ncbi:uncharacterized protein BDZ99DRAFT_461013 [Mytilinidion resinicola]|uniref:Uncharacterized protein n=1 Tax=Mytilinidion resinicola TaxID=574789 RepID=A0A6A6YU38_9PEZI|nr:uncharacterized protein BDZ99DRAFT_461013 [Mytilinidion resinicola]KAF2812280.1 hypothetical protein BDZ99DRAFT_461013 [Mytilinidion resinicola]